MVIDGTQRFSFTDYLDDISTVYLDNTSFTDPIAAQLADRGPEISEELRPAGAKRGLHLEQGFAKYWSETE